MRVPPAARHSATASLRIRRLTSHLDIPSWNPQRKEELLIDVADVALGHRPQQTWNPKDVWIFSDQQTHSPLVSTAAFAQVQEEMAARNPRSHREVTYTRHPYAVKSIWAALEAGADPATITALDPRGADAVCGREGLAGQRRGAGQQGIPPVEP
ncbi:hypothetical protein [Streptomyces mirabilis]